MILIFTLLLKWLPLIFNLTSIYKHFNSKIDKNINIILKIYIEIFFNTHLFEKNKSSVEHVRFYKFRTIGKT